MNMPGGIDAIKPAGFGWAVTANDSTDLAKETRAVYIGGAGDLACHMYDPTTKKLESVTFASLPAGTVLPIQTPRILSTGTTATNIIALA